MNNDRKVLSFKIQWNDTSYDGGLKYYTLNYFLSDGTVSCAENYKNCLRLRLKKLSNKIVEEILSQ